MTYHHRRREVRKGTLGPWEHVGVYDDLDDAIDAQRKARIRDTSPGKLSRPPDRGIFWNDVRVTDRYARLLYPRTEIGSR